LDINREACAIRPHHVTIDPFDLRCRIRLRFLPQPWIFALTVLQLLKAACPLWRDLVCEQQEVRREVLRGSEASPGRAHDSDYCKTRFNPDRQAVLRDVLCFDQRLK
jgi:hypothetical protein